jgi:hypothetical protein
MNLMSHCRPVIGSYPDSNIYNSTSYEMFKQQNKRGTSADVSCIDIIIYAEIILIITSTTNINRHIFISYKWIFKLLYKIACFIAPIRQ